MGNERREGGSTSKGEWRLVSNESWRDRGWGVERAKGKK